jgi:predicted secreted protein
MMADCEIRCITKSLSTGSFEHITHVGNPTGGWRWSVEDTIASIEAKSNTFYVKDSSTGKRADVGVVRPDNRKPYLRTYADGVWNDNLLALPSC